MGRTRRDVFARSRAEHYVVVWDPHWQVVDCRRVGRGGDLRAALSDAILRLEHDGWIPESGAEFGFAFVARAKERQLVMITGRDPFNSTVQTFSPFGT